MTRHELDAYETPRAVVDAALMLVALEPPHTILDPGAGTGVWGAGARARWPAAEIVGVELEPVNPHSSYTDWCIGDFLTSPVFEPTDDGFDLCAGNPPYGLAEEFVHRALGVSKNVLFLLRLSFLESQKRHASLWKKHVPDLVAVLPKRPSFTGGGTDATGYAIFCWGPGFDTTTRPSFIGSWLEW